MNWDKPSIIAVVIGAAALMAWFYYGPRVMPQTAPSAAAKTVEAAPAAQKSGTQAAPVIAVEKAPEVLPVVSISQADSTYTIQPLYGTVEKVTLDEKFLKKDRSGALEIVNEYPALAKVSPAYGAFGLRQKNGVLSVVKVLQSKKLSPSEYMLVRELRDSYGTVFTAVSKFKALDKYRLQVSLQIANNSRQAIAVPALVVSGGDLQQWCQLSGDERSNSQELHSVEFCTGGNKIDYENANCDADDWSELSGKSVRWFGVANRFFAQLMKTSEAAALQVERLEIPAGSGNYIVSSGAELAGFSLAPNAVKDFSFDYYLGPKQPKLLHGFDAKASEIMHLGWFPIDSLAYMMLSILNWLHDFVGSFGWSIILLTLLIRTVFFPVTMKANASMREMQVLSPKLKEIREKYKDEPMVAQAKMSELYREHKVNPLGGCLPMLIQIPVFIALYYALGSAAELRQQSFWWIKDLAQPDTVATVFGLAINPLIIAWTLLMVVQQKLTPTAMDPMQAKIMLAMPIVMLFILYSLPAALTLYWTVSQIFSIAQMMYQNKLKKREDTIRQAQKSASDKPRVVRS